MKKSGMWAIVTVALLVAVIIGVKISTAQTRTVRWDPVNTYTDGTPVEAGNAVSYSGWRQDNVTKVITQFADHIPAISSTFDDSTLVKGRTYNFWLQAHLATGASSDNCPVYAWTLPLGKAATPAGLAVQ